MDFDASGLGSLIGSASLLAGPAAPIVGGIGFGLSILGGIDKYEGAKAQTKSQIAQVQDEQRQDAVRKQAMETAARRQELETYRNQQRARALALNNATVEGAQSGSGLQGGYGQISGQSGWNRLGISQNLQSGEQMFGINSDISNERIKYAQAGGQINTGSGMISLGGAALGSMGTLRTLGYNPGGGGSTPSTLTNSWGGSSPGYGSSSWG